ncbi:SEL1-like repeat protein [Roseomonas gilardii]|uniref:SEL1-like repeat protein n=1 Tax=Roseomonas gilardii TaxID=257708 RepID=UPI0011A29BC7|nr:SEL1-like repeat protein [Roseomonas gilardii]
MAETRTAVVCGAIRTELELSIVIQQLVSNRDNGRLDRIILSTWLGEFQGKENLRNSIAACGVEIIEAPGLAEGGPHNMWRQKKALFQALISVPTTSKVLRLRTDKAAQFINPFIERLNRPLTDSTSNIFSKKIVVTQISATVPFMIDDFAFLGEWQDLYRLTTLDETFTNILAAPDIPAEVRWFYSPFSRIHPEFDQFFLNINASNFSNYLCRLLRQENIKLPPETTLFFRHYWNVVSSAYEPINNLINPIEDGHDKIFAQQPPFGVRDLPHARVVSHNGVLGNRANSAQVQDYTYDLSRFEHLIKEVRDLVPEHLQSSMLRQSYSISSPHEDEEKNAASMAAHLLKASLQLEGVHLETAELQEVQNILLKYALKVPFGSALYELGEAYHMGKSGLPQSTSKASHWWKRSASMRDPRALSRVLSTFSSIDEALVDPEAQQLISAVGHRDPDIFCNVAAAYMRNPVHTRWINEGFIIPRLKQLEAQGKLEATRILQEWPKSTR